MNENVEVEGIIVDEAKNIPAEGQPQGWEQPPADPVAEALGKQLAALTPWQRKMWFRKQERAMNRKIAKALLRAAKPVEGYCCPRCHARYATPQERLGCRLAHIAEARP